MKATIYRNIAIVSLRGALVFLMIAAGWLTYKQLPAGTGEANSQGSATSLQIILRQIEDHTATALDVAVDLYPVDIVAVRHEYFTEPREGKRFDDFLKDRMRGRSPVSSRLDKQGHGTVLLTPGSWWLHAKLSGDEEIEWRLPVNVTGTKQTVELNAQNAYTRSKSF